MAAESRRKSRSVVSVHGGMTTRRPKASEHDCGHHGLVENLSYSNEDPQHERKTSYQELERACPHPMKMATQSQTAGELPLEELLALCGYTVSDSEKQTCHMTASLPAVTLDKNRVTKDLYPGEENEESSADALRHSLTSNTSDLLHHLQAGNKDTSVSLSDEDDDSSLPSNEEHKDIMVGSMYQAKIPPHSPYMNQESVYNSEDQLLWRPGILPEKDVKDFLLNAQRPYCHEGAAFDQTLADTVRDNEQALYELVKCNFNAEEALRRLHFNVKVFSEELCGWSEEESRNFEHGYKVYGKNFHLIQANKVRTRSVGECVEYYYMWKKSDRHDYFTQQTTRITRKKYSLQSGSMEDGDQDVEAGETDISHTSTEPGQLESLLPPQSNLDLSRQDGRRLMGPSRSCADRRPQQSSVCPFPLLPDPVGGTRPSAEAQLQFQTSPQSARCACRDPPSSHSDRRLPGAGFFQLHVCEGPFMLASLDREPTSAGADRSPGCRWNVAHCVPHLPHPPRRLAPCCSPLPSSIATFSQS